MRRAFFALATSTLALSLVAARCSDDDEDMKLGVYPDIKGDADPSAAPPTDESMPKPEPPAEPQEAADDLFTDPLDGPGPGNGSASGMLDDPLPAPSIDDTEIIEDQQTFEPDGPVGSGLPTVTGPDGDSLPQVPGPTPDMPALDGGPDPMTDDGPAPDLTD